jgi:DNA processing protein
VLRNVELLSSHMISILGARPPTPYGNQIAERLSKDLADHDLVITSGLARGIDSCAQKRALRSARCATISVLGCGMNVVNPKRNRKIFADLEQRGAIFSEFAVGTIPAPQNFPVCNRIVAGMGRGLWLSKGRSTLDL